MSISKEVERIQESRNLLFTHTYKTNADHIRSMPDEELGLFLGEWADRHLFWMCDGTGEALYWLKQPYKEESNG